MNKARGCWTVLDSLIFFELSWDPHTADAVPVQAGGAWGEEWGMAESGVWRVTGTFSRELKPLRARGEIFPSSYLCHG